MDHVLGRSGVEGSAFCLPSRCYHLTECPDGSEPIWHMHCHISSQASGKDRKWLHSVGMPRVGVVTFFRIFGRALSILHSNRLGGLSVVLCPEALTGASNIS